MIWSNQCWQTLHRCIHGPVVTYQVYFVYINYNCTRPLVIVGSSHFNSVRWEAIISYLPVLATVALVVVYHVQTLHSSHAHQFLCANINFVWKIHNIYTSLLCNHDLLIESADRNWCIYWEKTYYNYFYYYMRKSSLQKLLSRDAEKRTESSCWRPTQCTSTSLRHFDV